jgi:hypothetical protein
MTDEKKPADLDPGGAEAGSQPPDEVRRSLARAALAVPVLMTLAPRSVLAQEQKFCPNGNLLSIALASAEPTNDAALASLAARTGVTEQDILDCYDCVDSPPGPGGTDPDPKNCVRGK